MEWGHNDTRCNNKKINSDVWLGFSDLTVVIFEVVRVVTHNFINNKLTDLRKWTSAEKHNRTIKQ